MRPHDLPPRGRGAPGAHQESSSAKATNGVPARATPTRAGRGRPWLLLQGEHGDLGVRGPHRLDRAVGGGVVDQHDRRLVAGQRGQQVVAPVPAGDDHGDVGRGMGAERVTEGPCPHLPAANRTRARPIVGACPAAGRAPGIGEQRRRRRRAGQRVGGQHHRGRRPRGPLDRPPGVVGEDVPGPVGAVVVRAGAASRRPARSRRRAARRRPGRGPARRSRPRSPRAGRRRSGRRARGRRTGPSRRPAGRGPRSPVTAPAEHRVVPVHRVAGPVGEGRPAGCAARSRGR